MCPWEIISLDRMSPFCSSGSPGAEGDEQPPIQLALNSLLLSLAPDGGYRAIALLRPWWSLTPPFHPCLVQAVCFCGPIRQVSPSRALPGIVFSGVRTFLDTEKPCRDLPVSQDFSIIMDARGSVNGRKSRIISLVYL